jgi:hypothetical protein
MEGHQIFVDALTRFAERRGDARLTPVIRRLTAAPRVAVRGRNGVGVRTVTEALHGAGVSVTPDVCAADLHVVVIAEAPKPEERAMLAAVDRPALAVLNKADLSGFAEGGPLARAHRRAADYRAQTGVPVVPMVAVLAVAKLDAELVGALRVLVREPADLSTTDAFAGTEHRVPAHIRRRLLATLDRFGIAHAVLALSEGVDDAELEPMLRRLSEVDRVVAQLAATAAPLRYQRVRAALTELQALAAQSREERLMAFLSTDETVLAVMAAAVDVVEAAGMTVDRGDDPAAHLRRAVQWRRYSRGRADALYRSCGADICRGSLRMLGQAR